MDYSGDYITRFDFDGDWDGTNNWENQPHFPLPASVYYWIVETGTNWFIGYAAYHPRAWSHDYELIPSYDNEMTGCMLVIHKDGSAFGQFLAILTVSHSELFPLDSSGNLWEIFSYTDRESSPSNMLTDGFEDIDGDVKFNGSHPLVYVKSQRHGVNCAEGWESGFPGGDGIQYVCSPGNAEVPDHNDNLVPGKIVYYDLIPIDSLWQLRNPDENPSTFTDFGIFSGGIPSNSIYQMRNAGRAPWAWDDYNDSQITGQDLFLNPHYLVDRYFDWPGSGFSGECIRRSFCTSETNAIIVTVDGCSITGTAINATLGFTAIQGASRKNYLEAALQSFDSSPKGWEIIPFRWNGDANITPELVAELKNGYLRPQYERAKSQGWKFIVVSHSWGTVLSYAALSQEANGDNPIRPDLLITLGSPLGIEWVPDREQGFLEMLVEAYLNYQLDNLGFDFDDAASPNCDNFFNYWAWGDLISGPIPYATLNIRVDAGEETGSRNLVSAETWHKYDSLQKGSDPDNGPLRREVVELIKQTVDDTPVRSLGVTHWLDARTD